MTRPSPFSLPPKLPPFGPVLRPAIARTCAAGALCALLLAGCATAPAPEAVEVPGPVSAANVPMPKGLFSGHRHPTLTITSRPIPDFALDNPATAAAAADDSAGQGEPDAQLFREDNLQDPQDAIAHELSTYIEQRYGVWEQGGVPVAVTSTDPARIAQAVSDRADLVLDIQSVSSGGVPVPGRAGRYRIAYTVKLRLIDVKSGTLVAEGYYAWSTPNERFRATRGELFEKYGELIREQLEDAKRAAVAYFEAKILAN